MDICGILYDRTEVKFIFYSTSIFTIAQQWSSLIVPSRDHVIHFMASRNNRVSPRSRVFENVLRRLV